MIVPATHRPDFALIAGRPCKSTVPSRVQASCSSLNVPCKLLGKKKKKISRILNYSRCDHYHHTTIFLYCKNACTILFLYKQKKFKRKYDMQW